MPPVDRFHRRQIDREGGPVKASDPPDSSAGGIRSGAVQAWVSFLPGQRTQALQVCAWFAVRAMYGNGFVLAKDRNTTDVDPAAKYRRSDAL